MPKAANTHDRSVLDAALQYAGRGWPVFPADSSGEKKSHKSSKHSNGHAWGKTTDATQIRCDFKRWPRANVGIATGAETGLFVMETDTIEGHNVDGAAALRALEAEHGALPDTLMAESPTGSVHRYFNHPRGDTKIRSFTLKPGIDVKGDGGMVIAPPSLRPGKGEYRWLNNNIIINAPRWLLERVTSNEATPTPNEEKEAEIERVIAALAIIPNGDDVDRAAWVIVGMATFAATRGSDDGFAAFDAWSRRHKTYNARHTATAWKSFKPESIGAGSLFHLAEQAWPGWQDDPRADTIITEFAHALPEQRDVTQQIQPAANQQQPQSTATDRKVQPSQQSQQHATRPKATPFTWINPALIPQRRWLYRPHYIRKFVSLTVSTGGVGKSSLIIAETLAMIANKPLLGIRPTEPLRVWYWNGEDPMDELQRRFAAAIRHYKLTPDDIGDRLYVDSGRTLPIVIAEDTKTGTRIATPIVADIIAELLDQQIDVLVIDPFVSCHRVAENDNNAIECVAKNWSHIAEAANCSINLAHHSRKTGGESVTVDDGRGASALLNAARTARTLNTMTTSEADNAEIDESERRLHFRSDIGKANLTRPAAQADWFKIESVDLGNGAAAGFGDDVGVVTRWDYPVVDEPVVDTDALIRVKDAIRRGGPWRSDQKATSEPWVGIPIAQVLGLDPQSKFDKKAVAKSIKSWLATGVLRRVDHQGRGADRHIHSYIEVAPDGPTPISRDRRDDDTPRY